MEVYDLVLTLIDWTEVIGSLDVGRVIRALNRLKRSVVFRWDRILWDGSPIDSQSISERNQPHDRPVAIEVPPEQVRWIIGLQSLRSDPQANG